MNQFGYCYDECAFNSIPRRTYVEGNRVITVSTFGRNEKLTCRLGYKQTVQSYEAMRNSEKNGTRLCPTLRKKLTPQ
jgi:hypothetical protein